MSTVNHPQHYGGDTTYETIKVIEAWGLGFHIGNVVKYLSRAGKKGSVWTLIEDLQKARWYLDRHIERLRVAQGCTPTGRTPHPIGCRGKRKKRR